MSNSQLPDILKAKKDGYKRQTANHTTYGKDWGFTNPGSSKQLNHILGNDQK